MYARRMAAESARNYTKNIRELKEKLETADAVVIGAGAGLSTSASFGYGGERFRQYFSDFEEKYNFHDIDQPDNGLQGQLFCMGDKF